MRRALGLAILWGMVFGVLYMLMCLQAGYVIGFEPNPYLP